MNLLSAIAKHPKRNNLRVHLYHWNLHIPDQMISVICYHLIHYQYWGNMGKRLLSCSSIMQVTQCWCLFAYMTQCFLQWNISVEYSMNPLYWKLHWMGFLCTHNNQMTIAMYALGNGQSETPLRRSKQLHFWNGECLMSSIISSRCC